MRPEADWLTPDWEIPGVSAYCSTRAGDFNQSPFDGFNTASHVGDNPLDVESARLWLSQHFDWQQSPQWLTQVHGIDVIEAKGDGIEREADAVYSRSHGQICTLHTADCLPVFFASNDGSEVALAHAGWRGLADGILQATLNAMATDSANVVAWLGPAISQPNFEVGDDVRRAFTSKSNSLNSTADACFVANKRGRWQCDLYGLARSILAQAGVAHVSGGECCTYSDPRFFSYRRDKVAGRLLSLIWIDPAQ